MSSTDSAFKALRVVWVVLAVIATIGVFVTLAILVNRGSTCTCAYTPGRSGVPVCVGRAGA